MLAGLDQVSADTVSLLLTNQRFLKLTWSASITNDANWNNS